MLLFLIRRMATMVLTALCLTYIVFYQTNLPPNLEKLAKSEASARMSDATDALAWGVQFVSAGEVARDGVWRAVDLVPEGAVEFTVLPEAAATPAPQK
jgi:peptide/nickel transport system permease protein